MAVSALAARAAPVSCPATRAGRIGPNAVIQLAHALFETSGEAVAYRVFEDAGHLALIDRLPDAMIDERVPAALFASLWRLLPCDEAERIARDAGRRTADYVLVNRIPRIAQLILRIAPKAIAARALLRAIERNAWTFCGSGACRTQAGRPALIELSDNPLRMPGCVWHQTVFERLFRCLVAPATLVTHVHAPSRKAGAVCVFEVLWS